MQLRFWIALSAVLLLAAGAVGAGLVVQDTESDRFHEAQREQAMRAARQAEAVAALSVGQLASAAAFFRAKDRFDEHEFRLIARPLLGPGVLYGTSFIDRVTAADRREFERRRGVTIREPTARGLVAAKRRREYFPIAFTLAERSAKTTLGYDLESDPDRAPYLRRARDRGVSVATPPVRLLAAGLGIIVYRPVYSDGAPTSTVAERRSALTGFASGVFQLRDLAAAAAAELPAAHDVQLRVGAGMTLGDPGELEDPARAAVQIANRSWAVVVSDPNRPGVGLPLLISGVGISLAALLAALILVWSRNERIIELEREAGQDSLTGLSNRRSFDEGLRREVARSRRQGTSGAMLMIDLDHFKRVNDTSGHPAGDRLLKEVAALLRRRVRETDVLARIGGDEFAIVLPNTGVEEALLVAEAIATTIRESARFDGGQPVTASIGIAMFGEDPTLSPESIASEADTAMYAAKDGGRDGVRVFDPGVVRETAPKPG
ncbi:MAG: diguanylate cyclase [Solirubrobacterales bacterium]